MRPTIEPVTTTGAKAPAGPVLTLTGVGKAAAALAILGLGLLLAQAEWGSGLPGAAPDGATEIGAGSAPASGEDGRYWEDWRGNTFVRRPYR